MPKVAKIVLKEETKASQQRARQGTQLNSLIPPWCLNFFQKILATARAAAPSPL